jgi:predicted helicase
MGGDYEPFPGICLTDTFQLYEKDDLISNFLEDNSKRRTKQKALPLRIIFGNPPYAVGQKSANDNNKQIRYPLLDSRISITYVQCSNANNLKGVYDSYVRAFRWASDRLANNADGIVAFITNSGYIHKTAMDGFRKSLAKEFQHIYIVNLRGDVRKDMLAGEDKEGENIFGHKSMTGIAITFLVKKSNNSDESKILYYDIGSSLTRDEKFQIIKSFGTISSIKEQGKFHEIHTDSKGKWIDHGVDSFSSHIIIGNKKEINNFKIFKNYSIGFQTARDAWCYNFSSTNLTKNINKSIDFFNLERHRFHNAYPNIDMKKAIIIIDKFINNDGTKFSWTVNIKHDLINNKNLHFKENSLVKSLYRPFTKMWLYFNHDLNERVGQIPQLFPDNSVNNMALCVTGIGARCGFSLLITNTVPNYHLLDTGQCFPFYLYEDTQHDKGGLLQNYDTECRYTKSNAITKEALAHFKDAYPSLQIDRKELFFYIYGILHSTDYREVYSNNLKDELPRIPKVKSSEDFLAFANAGKQLAKLHLYYEDVPKFPLEIVSSENLTDDDYYVTQMKFRKSGTVKDRSTIIYNSKITLKGIPLRAYDYIVSGKPAIAWVMKYQAVRTDPKSGIVNDANLWATETMKNPKYPLELLQRVITVSLETLKIIEAQPRLVLT